MVEKKAEHTTYEVGPISELRMRNIMEGLWQEGGYGREALREELREELARLRLIDYVSDVGEYSEGTIVNLTSEGISVPIAYDDPRPECSYVAGNFSGYGLKVTVPAGESKTVYVGVSPPFKTGSLFQMETAFYLQSGLDAVVTWGIGSLQNVAEEAAAFRVSYEGRGNWNEYLRSLPQEFFQTHNWVVFTLTNTSGTAKSLYVGRLMFAEYSDGFNYCEDQFSGYIPVTLAALTYKAQAICEYGGWMGRFKRTMGLLMTLHVQSDGVNTLRTLVQGKGGVYTLIDYSYAGTATSSQYVNKMIHNVAHRGHGWYLRASIPAGKGYIRIIRVQYFINEQDLPSYELYAGASVVTDNNGDTDTFTLLDYTTTPQPCQYAEIDHIEFSPTGTTCTVCHINVNGVQASENVALAASIVLTDLKQVEKLELLVRDAGTGATTVAYKIYYKRIDALLVR